MPITLPVTGPYTAKDQLKADRATKFIGRGSPRSSTHAYARAFGALANCSTYEPNDIVFISVEGNRSCRLFFDHNEIQIAAQARVTFITDPPLHRLRDYNIGEREVCRYLTALGYQEIKPGTWTFHDHPTAR